MPLDWDKLRVFHAVAEAGSFTPAGESLNLSQSAVNGFPPSPYPKRTDLVAVVVVDQVAPQLKSVCVRVFYDKGQSVDFQTYFKP